MSAPEDVLERFAGSSSGSAPTSSRARSSRRRRARQGGLRPRGRRGGVPARREVRRRRVLDLHVKRARIQHADRSTLDFVPSWYGERLLALGDQRCARIGLTGPTEPGAARRRRPGARRPRPAAVPQARAPRSSTTTRRTGRSRPARRPGGRRSSIPTSTRRRAGEAVGADRCTSCGSTRTTPSPPGARGPTRSSAPPRG